jgi:signal-transduction protein with cAMP-binding, CBS, and nucleotidyltransferase domain
MTGSTAVFRQVVADAMRPPPPAVPLGTECAAAVARMSALAAPCVLIVDAAGCAVGMLTDQDVTRRVAFQVPPGMPVEAVMSRQVPSVGAREPLYRAVARMRRQRLGRLLVVDSLGLPNGLLELEEALATAAGAAVGRMERLARDGSLAGLGAVKAAEAEVVEEMMADGVPGPEIQSFLSDINRDIHRRVIDRALEAMHEAGWGAPPVPFCILAMGSTGRAENNLDPDQDNGFILGDYPDEAHAAVDRFFVELAERMTRDLDAIGIPFCEGYVMATNPSWRKTLPQWRRQMEGWAERRSIGATLMADIFFDFQPIHGEAAMATDLRGHVTDMARRSRPLLTAMARDDTSSNVALGLFGRLVSESENSIHRGRIELKIRGLLPMVACARILALAAGIGETGTLKRIEALTAHGVFSRADADALDAAYCHIVFLLLRQQAADIRAGNPPGPHVELKPLTDRERALLADSLRAIDRLRKRVQLDLMGQAV